MKQKILTLIALFISMAGFSQTVQTQGSPNRATRYLGGLQADSTLVMPVRNHDSIYPNLRYKGRIQINSETNLLEYHNGEDWVNIEALGLDQVLTRQSEAEIDRIFGIEAQEIYLTSDGDINVTTSPEATFNYNGDEILTKDAIGLPNGLATLDSGGKIPAGQLPNSIMTFEGQWNAATNTPLLTNGTGNAGMVYEVTTAGTQDFGSGTITFSIGDYAVYGNDGTWYKSINSNDVTSVNGYNGVVELEISDIPNLQESLANISVFQAINEGSGVGYTIANRDPANYGTIGHRAVDFSYSSTASTTKGATGPNSVAFGQASTASGANSIAIAQATASGIGAFAMGAGSIASGPYSFSSGFNTRATQQYSFAVGNNVDATGVYSFAAGQNSSASNTGSFAIGIYTDANGYASIATGHYNVANAFGSLVVGRYNSPIVNTESSWVLGSPIFIAGNGIDPSTRSNAYVLFNDGTSTQYGIASYGADYSADYTDRSIPDVKWVEDKLEKLCVTDLSFTSTKSAAELNTAYPGVKAGFEIVAPNVGSGIIYKKTSETGQWIAINGTILNP